MSQEVIARERLKCYLSPDYFMDTYLQIYDNETASWIPFRLWLQQIVTLLTIINNQLVIILKARQLGISWLCLGYALWQMLFQPISTVLIFSKTEEEAIYLAGEERLRGMYKRLPDWLKADAITTDKATLFGLSNGSTARAFPTTRGDGYTATLVIADEFDLNDAGLQIKMLGAIEPTINAGGKLILLSRPDKSKPNSLFKNIFRGAQAKLNKYAPVFLPWHVRPGRDAAWYEKQKQDTQQNTGSLDQLHEQYPATVEEALAPYSLNKRFPPAWVAACYEQRVGLPLPGRLADMEAMLTIYRLPSRGRDYVAGADTAEGLPSSDDSVTIVLDKATLEQVAVLRGKLAPGTHAAYTARLCNYFNEAAVMPENSGIGLTFIQWYRDNVRLPLLPGHDGKDGWTSSTLGKIILYADTAENFQYRTCRVVDPITFYQLQSIERGTLRAPEGEHDDHADAFCLAIQAAYVVTDEDGGGYVPRVRVGY